MTTSFKAFFLCVFMAVVALPVGAAQYTLIDVPGCGQGTFPTAISSSGTVLGWCEDYQQTLGFLRTPDGTITTFSGGEGGNFFYPNAISGSGRIVGQFESQTQGDVAFMRSPAGHIKSFQAVDGAVETFPYGINNRQWIVGQYCFSDCVWHGFLLIHGVGTSFDAPGAGTGGFQGTTAIAINEQGAIAGYYADSNYIYHGFSRLADGTIASFDPSGSTETNPWSINRDGVIVGDYADANGLYHAFVRSIDGTIAVFDAPKASTKKGRGTFAHSINVGGVIAGDYYTEHGELRGFLRSRNGSFEEFRVPESTSTFVQGMNNNNQITGIVYDANGEHGYLRIP